MEKVEIATGTVSTLATFSGSPLGCTLSADDSTLYVSLHGAPSRLMQVDTQTGANSVFVGSSDGGLYADGVGTYAKFAYPRSILRIGGYIYIADSNNYCIRRANIATRTVTSDVAGYCSTGGAGGVCTARASLSNALPLGLSVPSTAC